ncbi:hypothetical protein [Amycolatopsis tolypomycina]|uniref:Secreted protein n=1 Tax=Amycolatopsis tolypomycina TaxID=208445 RepID=A0A1H4TFN8_9PSEU|nr:hypothetical protein [Amycolatopsis tolypomycina]SEC54961.1 hypothetical protein SAMN04489727_4167 [Amycolatopsis tolypomycina]
MRRTGALTAITAGVLAGVPFITGAAAPDNGCWATEPIELANEGVWTYRNQVTWCATDGKVTSVEVKVTHQVLNPACTWAGRVEESVTPAKDGTGRTAFDLSEFSCPGAIGAKGVNPWVIVTVQPDGSYTIDATGIHP